MKRKLATIDKIINREVPPHLDGIHEGGPWTKEDYLEDGSKLVARTNLQRKPKPPKKQKKLRIT